MYILDWVYLNASLLSCSKLFITAEYTTKHDFKTRIAMKPIAANLGKQRKGIMIIINKPGEHLFNSTLYGMMAFPSQLIFSDVFV